MSFKILATNGPLRRFDLYLQT